MNCQEFIHSDYPTKRKLLKEKGQYLFSRQEPKFNIDLFQVGSAYVEVYYYHHHAEHPVYIKAVPEIKQYESYRRSAATVFYYTLKGWLSRLLKTVNG